MSRIPSSGSVGFFQSEPTLPNQFDDDPVLKRLFNSYIPLSARAELSKDLSSFGNLVLSPQVFEWVSDAEACLPSISTHTAFGVPRTTLHTSEGWRRLQELGIKEGIVGIAYDSAYLRGHARTYQFLKYHVWSGSNAIVTCPSAMSDGAASLLKRHLSSGTETGDTQRRVFQDAYRRLTSRHPDDAWTSGQWMTERAGGSDVRGTETIATLNEALDNEEDAHGNPLGPWRIDGFKWFSSATDANMAILLAQTPSGISAFLAPLRRGQDPSTSNGVSIQRLKSKLGTRALPTAELVLSSMRAWPIGSPGRGIAEIATILNITRIHTAVSAMGLWGRGLAIARAYARVRRVDGGKLLVDVPAHMAALAANTVRYTACMQLCFFVVSLLGLVEYPAEPAASNNATMLRLLTPIIKAVCSKSAIAGLQECMESLGGLGYIDDPTEQRFNVSRLLRDCAVLSIWEGTTDVMAADMVRVVKGKDGERVYIVLKEFVRSSGGMAYDELLESIRSTWSRCSVDELKLRGREMMGHVAWIVACVLLEEDAARDGNRRVGEIARRWKDAGPNGNVGHARVVSTGDAGWGEVVKMDKGIVFWSVEEESPRKDVAKL